MIILLSIPFGILFAVLALLCYRHRHPKHAAVFGLLACLALATGAVSAWASYWLAGAL
ncbi:hypothetical protein [Geoalkalibacter halelectricus]|uniref:PEP-CTERM protein-sorting domain-containing protein n=1 Tax=Geoalkalibacter halelectricus TaxID=2847045 RepID=A0ABY5ZRG6_9BACT|nr:hypothetical protein [Geoalkalibacter halelectricus]MDO3378876.1 hypothetical protein [Geoalkalibacter halelectricus]UWZ79821.1 hypothetical protein L9S41_00130 [Geoalkalibacter halelectricus]